MPESSPLAHDTLNLPHALVHLPTDVPPTADDVGVLNDDVMIEIAPSRPGGTIRVKLTYAGRSEPIPADAPWTE